MAKRKKRKPRRRPNPTIFLPDHRLGAEILFHVFQKDAEIVIWNNPFGDIYVCEDADTLRIKDPRVFTAL